MSRKRFHSQPAQSIPQPVEFCRGGWHVPPIVDNAQMLFYLILILTVVPLLELVILLQVHHAVASAWGAGTGLLVTLGTIVATGVAGAALARHQGTGVLRQLQERLRQGELPGQPLVDGVLILIGAALLVTPGFLTDLAGFSLLLPVTRSLYRRFLRRWFHRKMQRGDVQVTIVTSGSRKDDAENRLEGPN